MKNLFIILLSIFSMVGLATQAQIKKPAATTKKAPVKTTTATKTSIPAKTAVKSPVKTAEKAAVKPVPAVTKQANVNAGASSYKAALGLKFIYGVSLTGKYFLKENHAIEGIIRYNGAGGFGSNIAFTGLYEYHSNINSVDGLRWYVGGGAYVNHMSWKDNNVDGVTTFGVSGVIGLEYKIKNLPLAISADWVPGYVISNNIGFVEENGGIGVKYTF